MSNAIDELQQVKSKVHRQVLKANDEYVKHFGDKGNLTIPPARQFAILTCMDARLDPAKYAGLAEGDAHVIRNAGGRASDDAIRSLVISHKLLGTKEWFVIHHTDCGWQIWPALYFAQVFSASGYVPFHAQPWPTNGSWYRRPRMTAG